MKKLLYILLAMCVALSLTLALVSCDSESDSKDEDEDEESSTQSTTDSSNGGETTTTSQSTTQSSTEGTTDDSQGSTSSGEGTTDNSQGTTNTPDTVNYLIRLVDSFGEPFEIGVDIEVFKNGVSVGEAAVRRGGARFTLEKGEYTFILKNFDGEYYYNEDECVIEASDEEITVAVYPYADESNKQEIWVPTEDYDHVSYNAVSVSEGGTYVTIDREEGTYFLFTPTRGGKYRISYESKRSATFGYYGSPHNVLSVCPLEVKDKAFEIEIKDSGINTGSGGTTQIVIGISSKVVKNCLIKIERIGNAAVDLPWVDISADKNAVKVDNYINSEFIDFDVKDESLTVVFNENDGYYHLNSVDGPVIFVRISTAVIKSQDETETVYMYLPSFITMCDTDRLGKVFFDDNGTIVLKESYNEMFKQYSTLAGTSGLYPLNQQLASAIKNIGEHKGWFDFDSELHIFGEEKNLVVKENAWLFACVYENQLAKGTESAPATVVPSSADGAVTYAALVKGGEEVVVRSSAIATVTIANAQGVKLVLNDGTELTADTETGAITALVNANENFKLVNEGTEDTVIHFTLVQKVG